jgi:hypothetical protein
MALKGQNQAQISLPERLARLRAYSTVRLRARSMVASASSLVDGEVKGVNDQSILGNSLFFWRVQVGDEF